jgi:eukaryotic-like serine/threonine-protein kinase
MVIEMVDGPTLSELVRLGPLPAPVAAVVGARVASALDHAHRFRITHRDIKPANVMVNRDGEVKLMDFGIAKDEDLGALTQKGLTIGTPAYMSPEQIIGDVTDGQTDIYSLGVLLYECLCGKLPFIAKNTGELFAKIRSGKYTPLRTVNPDVPRALEKIVARAMRAKTKDRYPDAAAMRRDLELFLGRHVKVSHAAVLMNFLVERGRLTESEALARISERELKVLKASSSARRLIRRVALAAAALALAAGYWYLRYPLGL